MARRKTPLLDSVPCVEALRALDESQLPQLADEVRQDMIAAVSKTGGHLGAGLGVVELTIALHYVFNTPLDRLIWDVGHQSYPHKILTGRRDKMESLRQQGGLSGFTKRSESEFDPFGAGHSSTSVSAGLGMAIARDLQGTDNKVIAVIGDGAMSAGIAYEALNNVGASKSNMIVILNDNDMSIAPPVGAMSAYLSELISSRPFHSIRDFVKDMTRHFPSEIEKTAMRAHDIARDLVGGHNLFSQLGFFYIGPIDGHDFSHLLPVLQNLQSDRIEGPVLVHVVTEKGYGHPFSGPSVEKYHAVPTFNVITGEQAIPTNPSPTYTHIFADTVYNLAQSDKHIVAITAAMPSGTGLTKLQQDFPNQVFDVGIAEQHAITFAAGLATESMKPFVAIYSTFLQRGYDQLIHDVALQNLPVRFVIDRAGFVGADGATHAGIFDLAYLSCLPNMVIMCPCDGNELVAMIMMMADYDDGPSAVRYPRGKAVQVAVPAARADAIVIGKSRLITTGEDIAIISLGTMLSACSETVAKLSAKGYSATLVDARFAKPFDKDMMTHLATHHKAILIVEESSPGGFSAHILQYMATEGLLDGDIKIRIASLPDRYFDHAERASQLQQAGLDSENLYRLAATLLDNSTTLHHRHVAGTKT